MKLRNPFFLLGCRLQSFYGVCAFPLILSCFLLPFTGISQCTVGYNQVTLNWNNLDYFSYTGMYVAGANGYLASNAQAQTQNFAFGTQRVVISNNYAAANNLGENALHTGDAASYGIGTQDINFNGNGTITYTFENEVQNLRFSIYDLDGSQNVTVSAQNTAAVALPVLLTKAVPLSASIAVNPVPLTAPSATSTVANIATNINTNTINVDIAGPVKTVTIVLGATAGDFWLSNIIACSAGTFPNNWYNISRPFTGQPGYVLHAFDDDVYAVNPANGVTKYIFTDPVDNVNSMAYDPYNRILYYVNSLTPSPGTNRTLKKYDFNTRTISTVLADITTIGIPVVSATSGSAARGTGVESGAAAFYNGSLYMGIETNNKNGSGNPQGTSNREAVIWKIDFNVSNIPYRSSQVFAMPTDDGSGNLMHDWSDFVINDGILYDFDGAGVTTETDIFQVDMITSATTNYSNPSYTPGQPTVGWNGNLYQTYATANAPVVVPYIALYNPATGTLGSSYNLTSTPAFSPAVPSLGDAAEAFRPLVDYGDAPATYDPAAADPAVHELDANLRLGAAESEEWLTRGQTALADQDNLEDGLGAAPSLLNFNGTITYSVPNISVFNNTGSTARLIGWLDFNMNGVFDAGEGRASGVINSSASAQLITLTWAGIFVPNTAATATYLRLRLTRTVNGMTTSTMTGYMPDGEVEDYRVVLGTNLPVVITSFDVQKGNGKTAILKWTTTGNITDNAAFEIERSADGQQWSKIGTINTTNIPAATDQFSYKDENPLSGKSFYRIKAVSNDGIYKYTEIKNISFSYLKGKIVVSPNPVTDYITIQLSSGNASALKIALYDHGGKTVYEKNAPVIAGDNTIRLSDLKITVAGVYYIKLKIGEEVFTDKLVVVKH